MNSKDLALMGIKNLIRRRTRTILTVLGVVIGSASIIIMISLGIAMNENFQSQLESMGSLNIIDVSSGMYMDKEGNTNSQTAYLNDESLIRIESMEHVKAIMPFMYKGFQAQSGKYMAYMSVNGIDFDRLEEFDFVLEQGSKDQATGKYDVIYGFGIKDQFYDPKARMWQPITIDLMSAKIIFMPESYDPTKKVKGVKVNTLGILKQGNNEKDWGVYMDIEALEALSLELSKLNKDPNAQKPPRDQQTDKYTTFKVKVDDINNVIDVQNQIKEMGFQAWSLSDILESMKETSAGIRAILGGVGAVSLFIAAIGITNTMVMSIYERTKEIAVMKVLGAELSDIKKLFLFEAGLIGFFGGVAGIIFSYLVSFILNSTGIDLFGMGYYAEGVTPKISIIPLYLTLLSLGFSTVVGIIAGYYPAKRAMKLSVLEALRNE
jgi:ABC-type antimicrobial peptide transport system permease subunit